MSTLDTIPASQPIDRLTPDARAALEQVIAACLGDVFPALTLCVIRQGDVLLHDAWGWLDPESRRFPTRPASLFDLASVSKLFTITAFLTLVSEGRAGLDDPLIGVVSEFGRTGPRPLDGGQDPHTKAPLPTPDDLRGQTADPAQVTFRHLLAHTSGLAPWRDVYRAAGPAPLPPDQPDPVSRRERWANALHALGGYPFVGQPGDGIVRYSDLGLMLLGEATSRLHGTPGDLETAIRARVLEPLGLATITYNPLQAGRDRHTIAPTEDDPGWRGRRCWGEVHDENACGVGGVAGHAGLFGAARDVAALGQAWLSADPRLGIAPGVRAEAIREQARTGEVRRGLGWMLKSLADSAVGERFSPAAYGHLGFTGTSLWIDPDRALVVACLTNRVYPGRDRPGIHAFRRAAHNVIAEVTDKL